MVLQRMRLAAAIAIGALLTACSPDAGTPAAPAAPAAPVGAQLTTSPEIVAADIAARVKELADDKYEGRGPGTVAGEASAQWIADEMKRAGIEPGVDGSYFQIVEMVAQTADPEKSSLVVNGPDSFTLNLKMGPDAVFGTKRQDQATVSFSDSDLVFVGYGVNAPEWNWNDYEGLDVRGKTVVMFVNDPGFITNDDSLFNGKAMTYYGRWTYKYEEAARQGATAALIIHESVPAAYGWNVVESSWTGEQADLVRADAGADRALLEGWVTLERATELFNAAGLNIDEQRAAANKRGFKAVPMTGLKASATITQTIDKRQSRNVAGTIRGATAPDEHVILMAHWDHLGKAPGAMPGADAIYNGAVDNATGVAAILEIGEALAAGERPARSVTLLAVTLEESGLLGSAYFAENPFIPLNKIVAGYNIDAINPIGRTRDVSLIGDVGASELVDILQAILTETGRVIRPDAEPEAGYFYRSDHISLAKKGVPMIYVDGGLDALNGGEAEGIAVSEAYRAHAYHATSDEFRESWDFSGMEEDGKLGMEWVLRIANSTAWPNWKEGAEFKAARDAMMSGQ